MTHLDPLVQADLRQEASYRAFYAPFSMLKPTLVQDGNQWCCLLGANLQVGIAGFGTTPNKAIEAWTFALSEPARVAHCK